jgi:hypothetical protein
LTWTLDRQIGTHETHMHTHNVISKAYIFPLWKKSRLTENTVGWLQILDVVLLLTRGLHVLVEVDGTGVVAIRLAFWQYDCKPESYWAFISCISCKPSSSLNIQSHLLNKLKFSWQSIIHCRVYHVRHHVMKAKHPSEFHIIFTVHSVLYNSFYFNQHMHYNCVVIYTPTYVSTTYSSSSFFDSTIVVDRFCLLGVSKFHIIFTVHSVLYNSFYFNQHMHYNFVVETYVGVYMMTKLKCMCWLNKSYYIPLKCA